MTNRAYEMAQAVAQHLDGFTASHDANVGEYVAYLKADDGRQLNVLMYSYDKRATIGGSYPGTRDDIPYNVTPPTITVDPNRAPKATKPYWPIFVSVWPSGKARSTSERPLTRGWRLSFRVDTSGTTPTICGSGHRMAGDRSSPTTGPRATPWSCTTCRPTWRRPLLGCLRTSCLGRLTGPWGRQACSDV